LIISKKLDKIFLTHKDRLLRFGSELVISIAKEFGTEVIILNKEENLKTRWRRFRNNNRFFS
jgi:predicted site-specific integrase-resolvase